jgi:ABC-2 type transport system permease protein
MSDARRRSTLRGTTELVRLHLRTGRIRIAVWLAGVVGLVLVSAGSVRNLYGTPQQVDDYVALIGLSPNMVALNRALNGPGFGFDDPNVGVVLVNEVAVWGAVAFSLMAVVLTARDTRGEEDAQRTEVVRARMVGRHAPLAAAGLVTAGALMVAAAGTLLGLLAMGYAAVGSVALVCAYVAAGAVAGGVTALAAQVVASSRATVGVGVGALGVAFLVRALGDMGDGRLSWLSPIGWVHRLRPFAGEQWWVLSLSLAATVVTAGAAVVLSDRRNLGAGLVPPRLGRRHAGPWTAHRLGLLIRLQRGAALGWAAGLFVLGLVYGSIARDIEAMFADNPDLQRFIPSGPSPTDAYLAYTLALGVMMAGGAVTSAVLRLRGEESSGRLELVLAHPVARWRWLLDHLCVALGVGLLALLASGLGTGLGVAYALDDPGQVPRMIGASLSLLPVVLVLIGLTTLCVGLVPRLAVLAWLGVAVVVVIGLFAELFRLPGWVRGISPLYHLAPMPAAGFEVWSTGAVSLVALALAAVGTVAFMRRDVPVL